MKKLMVLVVSLLMVLSFASCAKKVVTMESNVNDSAPAVASTTPDIVVLVDGFKMEDIFFAFDKSTLSFDSQSKLIRLANHLKDTDDYITIEGHADKRGTYEYNIALGERRAASAKKFLVDLGINPSRIDIVSFGEEKPVCQENTEECFQKNRRDHFLKH